MKFGYAILYCADVPKTVAHYERAFRLKLSFLHDSKLYAEMSTGETILAFAANAMTETTGITIRPNSPGESPAGFEVVLVDDDVAGAYAHATANEAQPLKAPHETPWGQTIAYVRDINGCLVELASPLPPRPE